MPMTANGIEITPLVNGLDIEKVMVNGVDLIWEAWKEFVQTLVSPESITDSEFAIIQSVTFTNDDTFKITKVECSPSVYLHANGTAQVYGTIEVSDDNSQWTVVKKQDAINYTGTQGETYTAESISYEWPDGCSYKYIRCCSKGTEFKRQVTGVFSGNQKGN